MGHLKTLVIATCTIIFLLFLTGTFLSKQTHSQKPSYDILIVDGQIVDGTGSAKFKSDVGMQDDEIVAIGDLSEAKADRTINANGLIVAPGFIDVHNHTAVAMMDSAKRFNEALLRQGVTTIVGGPDGRFSPGMIKAQLKAYRKQGIGTNIAFYVGHNGVRLVAMGEEVQRPFTDEKVRRLISNSSSEIYQRAPNTEEMKKMKSLVKEGMELGAVGLSTGLMYPPGMYASTEEVVELARVVKPYGGIYDSHVRDPVRAWLESNQEAIEIGEQAEIPVKLGHLKAVGLKNTPKVDSLIAMVESARERGVTVVSDQYPYDGAGGMTLSSLIVIKKNPLENRKLLENKDSISTVLSNPSQRSQIKKLSENGIDGGFSWINTVGYSALQITNSQDYPSLVGKYLSEIAEERGIDPFDLVVDLYLNANEPVDIKGGIEEETIRKLLQQPWNMIASDGAYADETNSHPRSTGTFPRVLGHYIRELNVLSLEEAIRKMTSFPADFIGLQKRGKIAEGFYADIVIFDPETIDDRSTYEEPNLMARGVHHVLVNGLPVLLNSKLTRETSGRFLKQQSK